MVDHSLPSADLSPAFALRRLIFGHRVTEMIAVATRLGLADLLGDTAQTAPALAAQLDVSPDAPLSFVAGACECRRCGGARAGSFCAHPDRALFAQRCAG